MNASSDMMQTDSVAAETQEQTRSEDTVLVEMGTVTKVTKGLWLGNKLDPGFGWIYS